MDSPVIKGTRILSLVDRWRTDSYATDLDFAELMRHYNGGALLVDSDDGGRERVRRANLLFGHKFIGSPAQQLYSSYLQPIGMLDGKMQRADNAVRRQYVEQVVNREINEVVRESERLKWPYKALCGDAVIWGLGCLYRDDPNDWCPKYGRPLYAWDAPADITDDKFAEWAFPGRLTVRGIISRLKRLEEDVEEGQDAAWNREALRSVMKAIVRRHGEDTEVTGQWPSFEWDDPVEIQTFIESQTWGEQALNNALPVYWFFAKDFSGDNSGSRPIDMYCVSRFGEQASGRRSNGESHLTINRKGKAGASGETMFYQRGLFNDVRECFFPYVVDVMEGGEPLMRRVLGLGAINYDLDIRMQNTVNAGLEGAEWDFAPFFQADEGNVSDTVLQALQTTGVRPFDVFPQGLNFVEKPRGMRPYQALMQFTQLFNAQMGQNAAVEFGANASEGRGRSELEVQVLERQAQAHQMISRRMEDWIDRGSCMCKAMGSTITSPYLLEWDVAWAQQLDLVARIIEYGISPEEVLGNFRWTMRKPPGSGDKGVAFKAASALMSIGDRLPPGGRRVALNLLIQAIPGLDDRLAQQLLPETNENPDQVSEAQQQNAVAFSTLIVPVVRDSDLPGFHVPVHIEALQQAAKVAAESGETWGARDALGFQALAGHTMADINQLGAWDENAAKQAAEHLGKLANIASKFQIAEEQQQQQIDPAKKIELGLKEREQQRREQKDQTDLARWGRTQEHREDEADRQGFLRLEDQRQNALGNEVQRATAVTNSAVQIASLEEQRRQNDLKGASGESE